MMEFKFELIKFPFKSEINKIISLGGIWTGDLPVASRLANHWAMMAWSFKTKVYSSKINYLWHDMTYLRLLLEKAKLLAN